MLSDDVQAAKKKKLRTILVEDLGRDALVFSRYGLALVDAEAAVLRPASVSAWLSSVG